MSAAGDRDARGYRVEPGAGPRVRTDVVEVYVARRGGPAKRVERDDGDDIVLPVEVELLQIRRAKDPLRGSWQPVLGHIEAGESAVGAAQRELMEEVGLDVRGDGRCTGMWALEQVRPFYIAAIECIVLSPRFVVTVEGDWEAKLNAEHDAARWVKSHEAEGTFTWPGQHESVREVEAIVRGTSLAMAWTGIALR